MPSNFTPARFIHSGDGQCEERGLGSDGKVHPCEMGVEDSYVADADVSSHPNSLSSGGGGETTDAAGSPLLQNAPTDDDVEHEGSLCPVTPPLRPTCTTPPPHLSCSAPTNRQHGLLSAKLVAARDRPNVDRRADTAARTPQPSPALQRYPTPLSVPLLAPHTPPPELKPRTHTPPPREALRPMATLESPRTSLPPLSSGSATPPRDGSSSCASSPPPPPPPAFEEEPDVCCICLEEYSKDNPMFRGECRHHFHLACLMEWKQRSNSCPMCCAETLHGVGDVVTPHAPKPADEAAAAARLREIAAQDEVLALRLQRKYMLRAQQQPRIPVLPTPVAPVPAAARPAPRTNHSSVQPLPPLPADRSGSSQQHHARGERHRRAHSGSAARISAAHASSPATTAATAAAVAPRSGAAVAAPRRQKSRKSNNTTPAQESLSRGRPRSTSPAVHPQFQGGQRQRRRSNQNGCTMM